MIEQLTEHICEAQICRVNGNTVQIIHNGELLDAKVAVMQPYVPSVGDTVLIIQSAESAYVIGVLQATGPLQLHALRGDISIQAAQGSVQCRSAKSVNIEAPMVEVQAHSFVQRLGSMMRFVSGLFSSTCKQRHVKVHGTNVEHAERTRMSSEKEYTINGSTIHMG